MNVCAYCGGSQKLTREHLVPAWYVKRYPKGEADAFIERARKAGSKLDMRIGDVCEQCNNNHLSELDGYAKSIYIASFSSALRAGERLTLSYDFTKLAKWVIKVSYNVARANRSEATILSQYAQLVISDAPLPIGVRLFCEAIGPAVPDELGLPRVAFPREEEGLIEPEGFRVGRLILANHSDFRWCLRRLTLDGFEFRLVLPDRKQRIVDKDLGSFVDELRERKILRNEFTRNGVACIEPPIMDSVTLSLGHERQFPVHYGVEKRDFFRKLI